MLTTEAFHAWCHRLQLAQDTVDRIATIRSSPPVRTVTGRAGNVAGRYPSPKMQRTIQFGSPGVIAGKFTLSTPGNIRAS
jgi:putative transposase